jgi:rare lipoprotein A
LFARARACRDAWNANKHGPFTLFALCALLMMSACAKRGRAPAMRDVRVGYTQEGIASWYGEPYHGRASASGEIYDMNRLTAAHQRFPFDTVVRVEHRATKQSVEVRINDRGPFVKGRIIDLSRAAAQQVGLLTPGTGRVRVRVIETPGAGERYAVQAGVFTSVTRAEEMRARLERRYRDARIFAAPENRFRVLVGHGDRAQAEKALRQLKAEGMADAQLLRR